MTCSLTDPSLARPSPSPLLSVFYPPFVTPFAPVSRPPIGRFPPLARPPVRPAPPLPAAAAAAAPSSGGVERDRPPCRVALIDAANKLGGERERGLHWEGEGGWFLAMHGLSRVVIFTAHGIWTSLLPISAISNQDQWHLLSQFC